MAGGNFCLSVRSVETKHIKTAHFPTGQPQSAAAVADGIACGGVRGVERQRGRAAQTSAGVQQDGDAVGEQNDGVSVRCVAA